MHTHTHTPTHSQALSRAKETLVIIGDEGTLVRSGRKIAFSYMWPDASVQVELGAEIPVTGVMNGFKDFERRTSGAASRQADVSSVDDMFAMVPPQVLRRSCQTRERAPGNFSGAAAEEGEEEVDDGDFM